MAGLTPRSTTPEPFAIYDPIRRAAEVITSSEERITAELAVRGQGYRAVRLAGTPWAAAADPAELPGVAEMLAARHEADAPPPSPASQEV